MRGEQPRVGTFVVPSLCQSARCSKRNHGLPRIERIATDDLREIRAYPCSLHEEMLTRPPAWGTLARPPVGCPAARSDVCLDVRQHEGRQRRSDVPQESRRAIPVRAGSAQRAPTGETIAYRVISGGYTSFAAGAARATGCLPTLPVPSQAREPGKAGCMSHRGRFFGKPLRTISCFRHQDAQTPPSPLVGEGVERGGI